MFSFCLFLGCFGSRFFVLFSEPLTHGSACAAVAQGSWNGALKGAAFARPSSLPRDSDRDHFSLCLPPSLLLLAEHLLSRALPFFVPPLKSLVCLWERLIRYPTAHELLPDSHNGVYKPCIMALQDHPIGSKGTERLWKSD